MSSVRGVGWPVKPWWRLTFLAKLGDPPHLELGHRGQCPCCDEVQGAHPLKTSEATGAAEAQLGPRAQAPVAALNKRHGPPMRTTCRVLHQVAGLRLSPGGLAQGVRRLGRRTEAAHAAPIIDVRAARAAIADETS